PVAVLREGQEARQLAGGVPHAQQAEPSPAAERGEPSALPRPGHEGRRKGRPREEALPGLLAHGVEPVEQVDLHSSAGSSPPPGADSLPSSPADSVMASSTAESKSSPSSSPNSLPIFFMRRATLRGSFSSRSPTPPPPASDSSRASSDFTVAKRDISRLSAVEPQRGQAGVSGDERRRTSRLTRRRQSWHSYS